MKSNSQKLILKLALLAGMAASVGHAAPILQDWAFDINGQFVSLSGGQSIASAINGLNGSLGAFSVNAVALALEGSSFDTTQIDPQTLSPLLVSGLGTIVITITNNGSVPSGPLSVNGWFKYSFSGNNDGFFGDYATISGSGPAGQRGWALSYDNVLNAADPLAYLEGTTPFTNEVPTAGTYDPLGGSQPCCNPMLGLGYYYESVATGNYYRLSFTLDSQAPLDGSVVVAQGGPTDGSGNPVNPGDPLQETLYLSGQVATPEPAAWTLGLVGFSLLILSRSITRRRNLHRNVLPSSQS